MESSAVDSVAAPCQQNPSPINTRVNMASLNKKLEIQGIFDKYKTLGYEVQNQIKRIEKERLLLKNTILRLHQEQDLISRDVNFQKSTLDSIQQALRRLKEDLKRSQDECKIELTRKTSLMTDVFESVSKNADIIKDKFDHASFISQRVSKDVQELIADCDSFLAESKDDGDLYCSKRDKFSASFQEESRKLTEAKKGIDQQFEEVLNSLKIVHEKKLKTKHETDQIISSTQPIKEEVIQLQQQKLEVLNEFERSKMELNKISSQLSSHSSQLSKEGDNFREEARQKEIDLHRSEEERQKQKTTLSQKEEELRKTYDDIVGQRKEMEEMRKEDNLISSELDSVSLELSRAQLDLNPLLGLDLTSILQQESDAKNKLQAQEEVIASLRKELEIGKSLQTEKRRYQKEINSLLDEKKELEILLKRVRTDNEELKELIEHKKAASEQTALLEEEIDEMRNKEESLKKELVEKEEQLTLLMKEVTRVEEETSSLQAELETLGVESDAVVQEEVDKLKTEVSERETKLSELTKEAVTIEEAQSQLNKVTEAYLTYSYYNDAQIKAMKDAYSQQMKSVAKRTEEHKKTSNAKLARKEAKLKLITSTSRENHARFENDSETLKKTLGEITGTLQKRLGHLQELFTAYKKYNKLRSSGYPSRMLSVTILKLETQLTEVTRSLAKRYSIKETADQKEENFSIILEKAEQELTKILEDLSETESNQKELLELGLCLLAVEGHHSNIHTDSERLNETSFSETDQSLTLISIP